MGKFIFDVIPSEKWIQVIPSLLFLFGKHIPGTSYHMSVRIRKSFDIYFNKHTRSFSCASTHSLTRAQAMSSNLGQAGALYFFFLLEKSGNLQIMLGSACNYAAVVKCSGGPHRTSVRIDK